MTLFGPWPQSLISRLPLPEKPLYRLGLLYLCFATLVLWHAWRSSWTYDELNHVHYGVQILTEGRTDHELNSAMPIVVLNAALGGLAHTLLPESAAKKTLVRLACRLPTLLAASLLFYYILRFCQLVVPGEFPWMPLLILTFEPNLLAHASFATVDLYFAVCILGVLYHLCRFLKEHSWASFIYGAVWFGFAQVVKFTGVFLYVLIPLILFIHWIYNQSYRELFSAKKLQRQALQFTFKLLTFWFIVLLILNGFNLFQGFGTKLGDFQFHSNAFKQIQAIFSWAPSLFPKAYLIGLDRSYAGAAGTMWNVYILDRLSHAGLWYYYFICYIVKLPLGFIVLLLMAFYAFFFKKFNIPLKFEITIAFLIPIVLFFSYFSFAYNVQVGIRHTLFIIPLLICFLVFIQFERRSLLRSTYYVLTCWSIFSSLSYVPHLLPYMNEIVWNRSYNWKWLADSNINWGQGQEILTEWLTKHHISSRRVNPPYPQEGINIVSVNHLVGIFHNRDQYRWLREYAEPGGNIGYQYVVYHISREHLISSHKQHRFMAAATTYSACENQMWHYRAFSYNGRPPGLPMESGSFDMSQGLNLHNLMLQNSENIYIELQGSLQIENDGYFEFSLFSDDTHDDFQLIMNDQTIINNWGERRFKPKSVTQGLYIAAGGHPTTVRYVNAHGASALQLRVQGDLPPLFCW